MSGGTGDTVASDAALMQQLASESDCLNRLEPTNQQTAMGIAKEMLFMANLAVDFSEFSDATVEQQNRFARLQQAYHEARKDTTALRLYRLSPRMVLSESKRKLLAAIAKQLLVRHSDSAQKELLAGLEEAEKKAELVRQKRKLKKQKGKKASSQGSEAAEQNKSKGLEQQDVDINMVNMPAEN